MNYRPNLFLILFTLISFLQASSQVVQVGSGSYTTTYPGADEAGRNGFPPGTPQLSGAAAGKPVPTNDWWSKLVQENHAGNLFNYPMTMRTTNEGLIVTYIPWGVIGDSAPIVVGLSGLNAGKTTVSDYSDWTVNMNWNDGSHQMDVTSGIGMPFLYFEKESDDVLEIKVNGGNATISGEMLMIEDASAGADFVFYAPSGSSWSVNGSIYTSDLNGQDYWSMAMLPQSTTDVNAKATEYKKYAYVFPKNTSTSWGYNEQTGSVTTDFLVETEVKEGTETDMLLGLLPHQWDNLASGSPTPAGDSYITVRGEMKMLTGNSFSVENHFKGILPTMPYLANYSDGFSPASMDDKINQIANDGLATWTDSYNEGQVMNRLIQTARIADQTGNTTARDKIISTIKERLEDWLTYESGEIAFLFYYNNDWSAMLGYPAGHGQDNNINDHHFHWGYFIHAAAFMEQFEPGWAEKWGPMVNHLVRDAATENRADELYPYLRNFSPYAGHCWANGFASFPQGNDQESTSESMQFNSSLIHWGTITGNDEIRDLGIYLYTTEQTAIEEYWFDVHERNFADNQQYSLVSRVWGNSYDNGTFWTADITASYGIELYPMHGGSLYLAHQKDYIKKLWAEIESNTGILSNQDTNPNLWHDTFWKFLSFMDPQKAIDMYDAYPDRILKFGVSDAQTYHWLHSMNAMGELRTDITADYPIAVVFEKDSEKIYVAHNYGDQSLTVTFTDGFTLEVPAHAMATNKDADISAELTSNFSQAYPGGSVSLSASVTEGTATKVDFYSGEDLLGTDETAPFEWKADDLGLGIHGFYAKVYEGENFNVTNIINVQVGEQVPYQGAVHELPGTIEAAHYDEFQGGIGQNIAYVDLSRNNEGGFRPEQYVDAESAGAEGDIIGWIASGEWVEYTVSVQQSGYYNLDYRYASGNDSGGGPFHFEMNGKVISPDYSLSSTSGWDKWSTKSVSDVALKQGENVLRLAFDHGEFNLGKLTFSFDRALDYSQPVADAGDNVLVVLPATTGSLDGSASSDPEGQTLTYTWSQVYGPSTITFSDATIVNPEISNLEEGIYKCLLEVSNGDYSDQNEVLVIVSATDNIAPSVSITSPASESTFREGQTIPIKTAVSDLDGEVVIVEFFDGATKIGEDESLPFEMEWANASTGDHSLMAIATDNGGAKDSSQLVVVTVSEVKSCTTEGSNAIQGGFSTGYSATYETVGNQVKVFFELKDQNKNGVVAFLWKESPFEESQMDHEGGLTFSKNLGSFTPGETISYACKFAFAGGLAVTEYIQYQVGDDCDVDPTQDATLKDLKVDGVTVSGFNPAVMNYTVSLSDDITTVPNVTADPTVEGAEVTITPAQDLPGTTIISVTSTDESSTNNYKVDFVYGQQGGDEPSTAAPTPTKSASQVISLFSDAYDDVEVDTWRTGWSEANLEETSVAGNDVKKYTDLNFVGIETIASQIDINDMQYFHVDVWSPNSTTFRIKLVDFGANAAYDGGDDVEHELIFESPQQSQWVSYDIPVSQFANMTTRSNFAQLIFSSIPAGGSIAYIDNVYFYGDETSVSSDATLNDLKINGVTIDGFASTKMSYEVMLPAGTVEIPEVIANTSHSAATAAVNPATSLPGTTAIVVTAEDQVTTLTYEVSFVLEQSEVTLSHQADQIKVWSYDGLVTIMADKKLAGGKAEVYALSGKRLGESNLTIGNTEIPVRGGQVLIIRIFDMDGQPVKVVKLFTK